VAGLWAPRQEPTYTLAVMRELLANLPAGVAYVTGPDFLMQFVNERYRELTGWRDLVGRPMREALPELEGQDRFENMERVMATGIPYLKRSTEVMINRGGAKTEQMFVDLLYQPVHDDKGKVAGIEIYVGDVTSHVRDRQALEAIARELAESEERHRTLFETLPLGVIYFDADGFVMSANPAAGAILGVDVPDLLHRPLPAATSATTEAGSPLLREEFPVSVALRTGQIVREMVIGFERPDTGESRWLRTTAVPDAIGEDGRPQRAYAIIADIADERRAEATIREGSRLLGRLRDANVLGVVISTEDGIYEANDAFLDLIGFSRADLESGRLSYASLTAPEYAERDRGAYQQLVATGAFQPYDKEYLHKDGHRVPVLIGGAAISRNPLRWVTYVVDLTARQRDERVRSELMAREQAARTDADRAQQQLSFLLRAGTLVAASSDRQELLDQVARLVVPTLADYCVICLPTPDGNLRAAALAHHDAGQAEALTGLREHSMPAAGSLPIQAAFQSRSTKLVADTSAGLQVWSGLSPVMAFVAERLAPASAIVTPLVAARRSLGVMILGREAARLRFTGTDVAIAEELARSVAVGLANVDAFNRDHSIAETLQQAILPAVAPEVPGLDLAVRYLPASDEAYVGGDWYDAFPLEGGRVGLVIGDVTGHSIESASVMGQIRSMVRAYAMGDPSPSQVLRRTNAAMTRMLPDAMATGCYAVLDLASHDLAFASAGHPPPLRVSQTGNAAYLKTRGGVMLGVCRDAIFRSAHQRLGPGSALLFYTDGLIEDRGRDIGEGLTNLSFAMRRAPFSSAEQICAAAERTMLGSAPRSDDVCLLAVRIPG
jgi:sigma-B regulation protein RsbU (phosphoserine phosphatase)